MVYYKGLRDIVKIHIMHMQRFTICFYKKLLSPWKQTNTLIYSQPSVEGETKKSSIFNAEAVQLSKVFELDLNSNTV